MGRRTVTEFRRMSVLLLALLVLPAVAIPAQGTGIIRGMVTGTAQQPLFGAKIRKYLTDTGKLGTVGDNQLHMVSTYETATDTTHLKVQYDTNASFGTTALSSVIALDFAGDVTANLTTTSLTYI